MTRRIESHIVQLQTESVLSWIVNVTIVLVLPVRLGLSNGSLPLFLAYAAVCGLVLTVAEDRRYVRDILYRADVRGYLAARIAIVAVLGICPFLISTTFT